MKDVCQKREQNCQKEIEKLKADSYFVEQHARLFTSTGKRMDKINNPAYCPTEYESTLRDLFWETAMKHCKSLYPKGTSNAEVSEILKKLFEWKDSKLIFGEILLICDSCSSILKKTFE